MEKMKPANSKDLVPAVAATNSSVAKNTGQFNSRDVSICDIGQLPLPYELILQIFSYLPCADLWIASRSCREFKFIIQQLSPMEKHCMLGHPLITKPLGDIETRLHVYEKASTQFFNDLNAWRERFIKRYKMSEEEAAFRTQTPLMVAASIVSKAGFTFPKFLPFMEQESITAKDIDSYTQIDINLYLTNEFVFKIRRCNAVKTEVDPQGKEVTTNYIASEKEIMDNPTLKMQVQQKKIILHDLMIENIRLYFNSLIEYSLKILNDEEIILITNENTICLPGCGVLMLNLDLQKLYYINSRTSNELNVFVMNLRTNAQIKAIDKTENGKIALFSECSIIITSWCSEKCQLTVETEYPLCCKSVAIKKILPLGKDLFLAMTNGDISEIGLIKNSWVLWQRNHDLGSFIRVKTQPLFLQDADNCTLIDQDHIMVCKEKEVFMIPKEALVSGNEEEIQNKKIPLIENETIDYIISFHDLIAVYLSVDNIPSNDDGEFESRRSPANAPQKILKLFKICRSYPQPCSDIFEMTAPRNMPFCRTMVEFSDKPWIAMGFFGGLLQIIEKNKQGQYHIIATNDADDTNKTTVLKLSILSSDIIVSFHKNDKIQLWSIEQQKAKVSLVRRGPLQYCKIDTYGNYKICFSNSMPRCDLSGLKFSTAFYMNQAGCNIAKAIINNI